MKMISKPMKYVARDFVLCSLIGGLSLFIIISFICLVLYLLGYSYIIEKNITNISVIAVIVASVVTAANAYRERKIKKNEMIKKIITENRYQWLEKTRLVMAKLHASERTYITYTMEKREDRYKIIKDIDLYSSQLILHLPYDENVFCDEICCLVNDVKDIIKGTDKGATAKLLCRIRAQENKCRLILKKVWKDIKSEAKKE